MIHIKHKTIAVLPFLFCMSGSVLAVQQDGVQNKEKPIASRVLKSQQGGAEHSSGSFTDGSYPIKGYSATAQSSGCYDSWWISGDHKWSWKAYYFYMKAKLSGGSWTRYGTTSGPCDIPLTVDKLEIRGETYQKEGTVAPRVRINKTAYNTNSVNDSDDETIYGTGLTDGICGAEVKHTATKSYTSWFTITSSGCAGNPGTY